MNMKNLIKKCLSVVMLNIFSVWNSKLVLANTGEIVGPTDISLVDLFNGLIGLLGPLILLVFLAMIVYGGFMRMTAGGEDEKIEMSTKIITAGVVGFIIIALAPLIINLLGRLLGIDNLISL
jgi:hypothetical protein